MSDPGSSTTPYQPAPVGPPKSEVPLWTIVTACVIALVGAVVVTFVVLGELDKKDDEKKYPSAWDPRVVKYVKVVEKQRGLTFLHPVEVRFLKKDAFTKEVTADEKDLDKQDREEIEQATGQLRAIGLITGDVDLFEAFNDATGGGTLAFYSFEDERITIKGISLTPASRATLVHELTHALQDQHFGIGDRLEELREEDAANSEESVLDAIIEGDAERVATLYRESLDAKQRKALEKSEKAQQDQAAGDLKGVPKAVLTIISSPYALGESLTQAVAEEGGNKALDELYRNTPTHDAALYDPFQVLADDLGADEVPTPAVKDGEKKVDDGEFGALTWYFMLAERVPLIQAVDAVDGWGGDSYVFYEKKGVSCVRAGYRGDTDADTARMLTALRSWVAAAPGSPAKVGSESGRVLFESCDPGTKAKIGKNASIDALTLISIRNQIGAEILGAGAPAELASCVAGKVIREYSIAQLTDPDFGANDGSVTRKIQQFALACR